MKVGKNGVEKDIERDVVKVEVIERNGKKGNIEKGLVNGLGMKEGEIE